MVEVFKSPNSRQCAHALVSQLADDYSKAMKAIPVKIQIKDGE